MHTVYVINSRPGYRRVCPASQGEALTQQPWVDRGSCRPLAKTLNVLGPRVSSAVKTTIAIAPLRRGCRVRWYGLRGNTLRSINHGGRSGMGPAYSGLSGPTRKTGSGRRSGQHGELETRPSLMWGRRDLRTAFLRPMGAESVGPLGAVMTRVGGWGTSVQLQVRKPFLQPGSWAGRALPSPGLQARPVGCCLSSRDVCAGRSGGLPGPSSLQSWLRCPIPWWCPPHQSS